MADEELERITVLLQAKDRDLARAIDRSNRLIARMERDATRNTSRMARNIDSNLSRAASSVASFGKAFAVGAAATAVGVLTSNLKQGVRAVSQIGDEARRSGLGVEAFQELSYVATQSRIPIDALVDGMKELNLRADEFIATGKGPAADTFARIGLGATELERKLKQPDELLLDIIGRMESLDKAAQIRVADEIFGGTGGERFVELLAQGESGIRRLTAEAREMGIVMDAELIAKAQRIDAEFSRLIDKSSTWAKGLAVALADLPLDMVQTRLSEIFPDEDAGRAILGDEIFDRLSTVSDLTDEQAAGARNLAAEYGRLGDRVSAMLPSLDQAIISLGALGYQDAAGALRDARAEMDRLSRGLEDGTVSADAFEAGLEDATDQAGAALAQIDAIDRSTFSGVIAQAQALATALAEVAARAFEARQGALGGERSAISYGPQNGRRPTVTLRPGEHAPETSPRPQLPSVNFGFGAPDPAPSGRAASGGSGGGGGAPELDDWQEALEGTREEIARLEAEAASLLVAADHGTALGDAMEYAQKRAELLYAAQQAGREITPELTAEIDAQAMAYMRAAIAADENAERLRALEENAQRGADAMSGLFMSILDGSMSAKDAVLQLIAQIARVQMMKGFGELASGAGGGVFSWLGGLLQNAKGNAFGGGSVVPFAKGGVFDSPTYFPMAAGRTGVLGEGLDDEAILPLGRGRDGKLGVRAQVGGSASKVQVELIGGGLVLSDGGQVMTAVDARVVGGMETTARATSRRFGDRASQYQERGT
ncbi:MULTISPECIES: phage tail tape measure protein [Salipiger]|jgi:hypothetical protein|uniref:Gene Transfer Agent tail tape measure protein n=1 Tax=Salipiger profundus TaxID=1229727 RepID=A0A1U7D4U3_9RHOB|nr:MULTISPECIES: phage tail tape measure protein [Salipiger]APX23197.1 Gene Transfer Agent tail tape measure protein [Salipiger profundus]GGA13992.1 hypothetical protein GCM10011326_27640 [Salipiger profundus]SFD16086.1 hypothetical protein SAMN05444415_1083 [Salipiger profundus]